MPGPSTAAPLGADARARVVLGAASAGSGAAWSPARAGRGAVARPTHALGLVGNVSDGREGDGGDRPMAVLARRAQAV